MKLTAWRKSREWTQEQLAAALGCTQPTISQFERATSPIIPSRELMVRIYVLTNGAVRPDDFYDLPALVCAQLEDAA